MANGRRGRPSKYPVELRERAVRMVLEVRKDTGQTFGVVTRVAKELGIGAESLRKWVAQAEIDGGASAGTSTVDARRLAALERDNRELRRANAILREASHIRALLTLPWVAEGTIRGCTPLAS